MVELSLKSWLVAGLVPGLNRATFEEGRHASGGLVALVHRWRDEAIRAGRAIERMVVAFEAGRDGLWLAQRHSFDPRATQQSQRAT